jgi:hypothetical protein
VPVPDFAREGKFAKIFKPVNPSEVVRDVSISFDCLSDDLKIPAPKCYLSDHSKARAEMIKRGQQISTLRALPNGKNWASIAFKRT